MGSGLALYVQIQDGLISASLFLDFQTLVKFVLVNLPILKKKIINTKYTLSSDCDLGNRVTFVMGFFFIVFYISR